MSRKTLALIATSLLVGSVALAKGKGILYKTWSKPTAGTYAAPAAELGKKVTLDRPWSTTTVASAVDKPLKGRPITMVGEIIDLSCYLQVGKRGDKHRACGQKCVKAGQPVGLLAKDGTIYMLIDEEHDPRRDGMTTFRQAAHDHMAHIVKVHGTYSEVEGQKAIFVQGYVKAAGKQ